MFLSRLAIMVVLTVVAVLLGDMTFPWFPVVVVFAVVLERFHGNSSLLIKAVKRANAVPGP